MAHYGLVVMMSQLRTLFPFELLPCKEVQINWSGQLHDLCMKLLFQLTANGTTGYRASSIN